MLYIQDEDGTYLPASKEAIFNAAKRLSSLHVRRGAFIQSSDNAKEAIRHKLNNYQYEMFACLFLNSKHRVLAFQEMFRGSINCATIHPREVVKEALRLNASAVILAHNHPSGETEPSTQDIELTNKLKEILRVVDVRLLDHLVVGDTVLSMADSGYL
ncbi:MAG: DNA repair protein RadC [Deltaproteobacteria bacterium]|nr:DNA repair protein RadC [Deltaproteobacteria bacterium]